MAVELFILKGLVMQSGNSGSPQQGQGDNQANIERLLRELNDKMGLMVDVIEKRPRSDSPSSLYFSRRKHDIEIPGMEEVGDTRQFDELSGREKKQKVRQYSAKFAEENATMKQGLDNLNRLAFYTAGLDDIQKQHYKDEYERLKADYNRKLKLYAEEQTNIDAQIEAEKEAANAERAIAAGYRNLKEYTDKIAENDAYNERTESRREASTLVARSGLGNILQKGQIPADGLSLDDDAIIFIQIVNDLVLGQPVLGIRMLL